MFEEKVKLKNGKVATISLIATKDNYIISAVDDNCGIVGKCVFEIATREIKQLKRMKSEDLTEAKYLVKEKNKLNNEISCSIISKAELMGNNFQIDVATTVCNLNQIEILHEDYFKVGLGSLMIRKMKEFARLEHCQEISGRFYPNGNFWHGAADFYARNGFSFMKKDNGATYIKIQNLNNNREKL